eukprot:9120-Heterococcus_DN1.PRE.2
MRSSRGACMLPAVCCTAYTLARWAIVRVTMCYADNEQAVKSVYYYSALTSQRCLPNMRQPLTTGSSSQFSSSNSFSLPVSSARTCDAV